MAAAVSVWLSLAMVTMVAGGDSLWYPSLAEDKDRMVIRFDISQKMRNPYPNTCPYPPNPTQQQIRDTNMCIIKEKWNRELLAPLRKVSRRAGPGELPLVTSDRPVPPRNTSSLSGASEDCLYKERTQVRYYPGNCRPHDVKKPFAYWTWIKLWKEIQGDFSYMYDYVLWDKVYPERKENQLWYLINYLKHLAMLVENPVSIAEALKNKPGNLTLVERVKRIEKSLNILIDNLYDAVRSGASQTKYLLTLEGKPQTSRG